MRESRSRAERGRRALCVLLWARPGADDGLVAYEDQVLGIAGGHGCRMLQQARSSGAGGQPLEIQLLEFPSAQALDEFMTDRRRQSLADERDRVIAKTEIIEVQLVQPDPRQDPCDRRQMCAFSAQGRHA
jgi:uncharacterized protein (DUF1330 family)